ncbi:DMT family transporter [Mesorhizobium sp. A623]
MPDLKNATSPLLAVLVCTLGIFLLSAMDAAVKGLVLVLGAYNVLLWRSVFATFVAGASWAATASQPPRAHVLRLHVLRGVIVTFVALTFFFGLGRLPLAEAIALSFIAPLLALFLAAMLLGEKIGRFAVWGSVVGMAGVIVIMLGKFNGADHSPDATLGMAAILASAALYAYNLILARRQALMAKPLEIVFFQNLIVGITLGLAAPWLGVALPQELWLPLAGVTALALSGHFMMSWSYARAEAQYLIPTEYSAFVWAILLGWVFFHEAVGWSTMAGAGLIIAGCLVASRSKPRLAQPIEVAAV